MRVLPFLLICHLALASKVIDLSSNFKSKITGYDTILVKFFAPWCGHCKNLAPIFDEASKQLKKGYLGKVDCTTDEGKPICNQYGVGGFPTLKLFNKGEVIAEYDGSRTTEQIVEFIHRYATPAVVELKSLEEYNQMLSDKDTLKPAVIGFFKESKDVDNFKAIGDYRHQVRYAYTTNNDILEAASVEPNKIVLYRAALIKSVGLKDVSVIFDKPITKDNVLDFVKNNRHGICGIRTKENANDFLPGPTLVAYIDMDLKKNPSSILYHRNRMIKASNILTKTYKDLKFALSDAYTTTDELIKAGINMTKPSTWVILYKSIDSKYYMDNTFNIDNMVKFVEQAMNGEIEEALKSEPVPENPIDDGLHVVVAKTFKEIVSKAKKDVFIEFYAHWCGHCKQLAPILKDVAEELSVDSENVIIVKMNAAENEVPSQFSVHGYPTMYFIPLNSNPIPYSGGRTKEAFIEFIAKHSTKPLKNYNRDGTKKNEADDKEL